MRLAGRAAWRGVLTTVGAIVITALLPADAAGQSTRFSTGPEAFEYLHRVATHARCVNCHGGVRHDGQRVPLVGERSTPHPMNITCAHNPGNAVGSREDCEAGGVQSPGLVCPSCHGLSNRPEPGAPPGARHRHGAPAWQMPASRSFQLQDISRVELCETWYDNLRAGREPGRVVFLEAVRHHAKDDPLIAWAFAPGDGRDKPPGSYPEFIAAAIAWAEWLTGRESCQALDIPGARSGNVRRR